MLLRRPGGVHTGAFMVPFRCLDGVTYFMADRCQDGTVFACARAAPFPLSPIPAPSRRPRVAAPQRRLLGAVIQNYIDTETPLSLGGDFSVPFLGGVKFLMPE